MDLKDYFEETQGRGILATANSEGKVDIAIYSRPHFIDSETIAFIMRDRLTHNNLQSNPSAAYLFMESENRSVGKRLFITKIREEKDTELIQKLRRRKYADDKKESLFLVFFHIDKALPLIGAGDKKG